jgi:8-oxo-dGTP pyrophosphatase MutT (NUDIX family)
MKKGKYRNAVFVVTYAKEQNKIYYLVLKRKLHWKGWEFPKGGINFLETKKHAVKREVKEETGLKVLKMKRFNISGKYKYDKIYSDRPGIIGQKFSLYAVEVEKEKIKMDKLEHSDYKWLRFEEAIKKLTWANQKKCMAIVHSWLSKNKK